MFEAYEQSRIVGKCDCGGNLIIISSPKGGKFVGCSGYPNCKKTYSLPVGASVLKTTCEKCGLPLISYGKPRQRACLDFECANGGKKSTNEKVGKCPDCGEDLMKNHKKRVMNKLSNYFFEFFIVSYNSFKINKVPSLFKCLSSV